MSQKKAFVRYAQNKAVAGSLIIKETAPKVGVWKEIPYDLCCDNLCPPSVCAATNYELIVTEENLADSTGNTGIEVRVGPNFYNTTDDIVYYQYIHCNGFGSGAINIPYTQPVCAVIPYLFYFKNDAPIFLDTTNTEIPCIN